MKERSATARGSARPRTFTWLVIGIRLGVVLAFLLILAMFGCATTPTGRRQLELIPDDQMVELGAQAFAQVKEQTPISREPQAVAFVQCVADAVLKSIPGDGGWEVEIFQTDEANAFALPGGKIGINTGMLRITEDASQLAAVVGHEIAHVVADHSEARLSEALLAQAGLSLADAFITNTTANQLALGALGLGAQFGVLMPHSRAQELEADILGLEYMAKAGFEPRAAVELWRNMAAASAGREPPEFLSTHPANETRIEALAEHVPQALSLRGAANPPCVMPPNLAAR